jgi:hypothetical protein
LNALPENRRGARGRARVCAALAALSLLAGGTPLLVAGCGSGVAAGAASYVPDPCDASSGVNLALHFNGVSDFMTTGTAGFPTASDPQTLSMWVRSSDVSTPSVQPFVVLRRDERSGVALGIQNGTLQAWVIYGGRTLVQAASVPAGGWHHVAYVQNPTPDGGGPASMLYIDGTQSAAGPQNSTNLTPLSSWVGSFDGYADGGFFAGDLDEIRIWSVARTPAGILEDMQGRVDAGQPGLVAYFNCNVVCGSRVPDLSGEGNDGTLGGGDPRFMPTLVASTVPLMH